MLNKDVSSRLFAVLSLLIVLSPVSVYLIDIADFGRLQNNDYYGIVRLVVDGDSISRDPIRWLNLKSNEHRATLPMVVYALNMMLTNGNNLGLTVFSLVVLTLLLALLYRLLPADIRANLGTRTFFGLLLALFCYTPVAAHSVAMGFSGTQWFSSNLLAAAAVATLVWRAGRPGPWSLWPILIFGLLGAFCYSTSLLLWPALLAGAFYLRISLRRCLFLAALATVVYSLFVFTYEPLSYHPAPETRDFRTLTGYTGIFLGSLFTGDVATAKLVGWAGILASIFVQVAAAFVLRSTRCQHAPWLMIQIYAFANALGTAVSRSGFGQAQAIQSRYASIAALFWLGLVVPLGILAWRHLQTSPSGRAAATAVLAVLVAGVAFPMHRHGGRIVDGFAARGSRQGVAALAIRHDIRDNDILAGAVTPAPDQVWAVRDFLKSTRHVPFDRAPGLRLGERIDPARLNAAAPAGAPGDASEIQGTVERLVRISPALVRLKGWAFSPGADVAEVLLLDGEGTIRGEVVLGIRRPDLKRKVHARAFKAGWEGYGFAGPEHGMLYAYVRLSGDSMFYLLPARKSVLDQLRGDG